MNRKPYSKLRKQPQEEIPVWFDVFVVLLTGGILLPVIIWYRLHPNRQWRRPVL